MVLHRVYAAVVIVLLLVAPYAASPVLPGAAPAQAAPEPPAAPDSDYAEDPTAIQTAGARIKLPFPSGQTWIVGQGYNTTPTQGGSHWNCDPATLLDQPSQTQGCRAAYQYRYSFDLSLPDGSQAGRPVLSPVNGTIRWIDLSTGGMSIDLGDGFAVAFFHTDLNPSLAAGQPVLQGQQLATVSPPGGGGNGGWPHVHLTVWQTTDGGNWSRNAIPFTGANSLDGIAFPDLGATARNQHRDRTITSTNAQVGPPTGTVPAAPTLRSPASGTTVTSGTPALSWNASSGASEYQVVINDGATVSPWLVTTSWTTTALAPGTYTWRVGARNANGTSGNSPSWSFTVATTPSPPSGSAAITLNTETGGVASTLTVTGSGFGAGEDVRISWNSATASPLTSVRSTSSGAFTASVVVPNAVRGNHTLIARGVTSGRTAQRTFAVVSTLARTPVEGVPGSQIAVTVRGFSANEQVRLTWDGTAGQTLGTATTNSAGTGTVNVVVPDGGLGWHDYSGLGLTSNSRGYGAINVLASLAASPKSGTPGTTVQVNLRGFPASRGVNVAWNRTTGSAGQNVCTGIASALGVFGCTFSIPSGSSGTVPVVAIAADGTSRSTAITVGAASGPIQGGTIVGPGTFRVTGTREGLVGGTTASGHVIQEDDHFVSLPACTSSSCPWLGAGVNDPTFGVRTECGNPCYVRVTNPLNNACVVAPVLDVGPWFRVDDWWNPTTTRNLNRRAANPNDLVQGYTGADAARDGYDVGYGRSSGGIGITDKGSVVGNRSSIDLGDGVWTDLGFAFNDLMRPDGIVVTFLWQTGESASAAAKTCGSTVPGPSPSPKPSSSPSPSASPAPSGLWLQVAPSSGRVGGRITATGSGFRVGETVNVYWDSSSNSPRATLTVDSRGDISTSFSVFSSPIGSHRVIAVGASSGRRATATYQVTPTITGSPSEVEPGGRVTLTIRGFGAGESVNLTWDGGSTSLGRITTASNGTTTATVSVPRGAGGAHRIVGTGASSGASAEARVTVSSSFSLSTTQAPQGTRVTATLDGYPASSTYAVFWNRMGSVGTGTSVCGGTTSSSGTASCTFTVPSTATSGATYPIVAVSGNVSKQISFVVAGSNAKVASAIASPAQARSGQRVNVIVSGFESGESVSVFWDSRTSAGGTRTTSSSGEATIGTTVPTGGFGTHTVMARGASSGRVATTYFTIIPTVILSPSAGASGTKVSITGKGFDPGTNVSFYWNRTSNSGGTLLCSDTTSGAGTASCTGTIPARQSSGAFPIVGLSGAKSATTTFTISTTFAAAVEAASPTAPSTATATASPEGSPVATEEATPDGTPVADGTPVDISLTGATPIATGDAEDLRQPSRAHRPRPNRHFQRTHLWQQKCRRKILLRQKPRTQPRHLLRWRRQCRPKRPSRLRLPPQPRLRCPL